MASVIAQETATTRARAIRTLLARPLIDRRSGSDFSAVVAHAQWLQRWFDDKCGWVLVVDARHGFARLRKVPTRFDGTRGLRTERSTRRAFTPRRYSLVAVAAAALSDTTRPQISLRDLADRVQAITADTPGLANFAPRRDERIALSDAVTYLIKVGILHVVEARGDYVADENANALYDIDDRRLGHLISAPFPPSLATTTEHLLYESRYGPWVLPQVPPFPDVPAASDDQVRLRARHRIMRILLDDPVLYLDQLSAAERSYLQQTIGGITNWVTEAGMVLERRAEGWAAIDPDSIATAPRFPEGNDIVSFAGLLLLSAFQPETVPDGPVRHPLHSAERVIAGRLRTNPTWARAYQTPDGPGHLATAALALLSSFSLAAVDAAGFTLLPAAGRYRPDVKDTTSTASGQSSEGQEESA
jgi:uncharacterized protein (TIGR02678 family)